MKLNLIKILLILIFPLVIFECTSRKNNLNKSDLIPASVLPDIMTDIYITNGLLTVPRVHHWYVPTDTLGPYADAVKKYGYTKQQLDRTMKWYFVRKPKKLIKIYDKVLARLSEMEIRYAQEADAYKAEAANLWKGRKFYASPDLKNEGSYFEIRMNYPGVYHLSFTATIHPDDQSVDPAFFAYFQNPDSTVTEKTVLTTIKYIKDGAPHNYYVRIDAPSQYFFNVKGWFVNSCVPESHFLIENIEFSATSGAL